MVLMSDAGGDYSVGGATLTFDDQAIGRLPDSAQIVPGTYNPTDYEPGDPFPNPAPHSTYASTLSIFNGGNPNGVWSLFVVDDAVGDVGSIDNGWNLALTTVGRINPSSPSLSASTTSGSSNFTFTIHGEVGDTFITEASPDITGSWTPLATNVLTGVSFDFQDSNSAAYGRRFYRVRRP